MSNTISCTTAPTTRMEIRQINQYTKNVMIVGLLIAKSDIRLFERSAAAEDKSRRPSLLPPLPPLPGHQPSTSSSSNAAAAANNQKQRGVQTMTIRDGEQSYINCSVWGSAEFVASYNQRFQLGDILSIIRPQINCRPQNDLFKPKTSSAYSLAISESGGAHSEIQLVPVHVMVDIVTGLRSLMHKPLRPLSSAMRLTDIRAGHNNNLSSAATGDLVHLVVVIVRMGEVRPFRKRVGHYRDVVVADQSLVAGVHLKLWNEAFTERSTQRET